MRIITISIWNYDEILYTLLIYIFKFSKNGMYGFFRNMIFLNLYLKKEIMFSDIRNILTNIKRSKRMFTIILLFKFILEIHCYTIIQVIYQMKNKIYMWQFLKHSSSLTLHKRWRVFVPLHLGRLVICLHHRVQRK